MSSKSSKVSHPKSASASAPAPPSTSSAHDSAAAAIPAALNPQQLKTAIVALYSFLSARKSDSDSRTKQLFSTDEFINLQFGLKKIPQQARSMPYRIALKNSIYKDSDICLFTKDPAEVYEERKEQFPVSGLSRVLSVSKLRKEFGQYKDKRDLLHSHDLFLADKRVIPLLQPLLGVKFFESKKQPAPVEISDKTPDWTNEINAAIASTYLFLPTGISVSVKIARVSFSKSEIYENIINALPQIVSRIPRGWANIQSLMIKTADSVALPFYASLPFDVNLIPEAQRAQAIKQERIEDEKAGLLVSSKAKQPKRKRESLADEEKEEKSEKQAKKEGKTGDDVKAAKKSDIAKTQSAAAAAVVAVSSNSENSKSAIKTNQKNGKSDEKVKSAEKSKDKKIDTQTPAKAKGKTAADTATSEKPAKPVAVIEATPAKNSRKSTAQPNATAEAPATESKKSKTAKRSAEEVEESAAPKSSRKAESAAEPASELIVPATPATRKSARAKTQETPATVGNKTEADNKSTKKKK